MWLEKLKYICFTVGGLIGSFLGGMDGLLYALTICLFIDYATGVMVGYKTKELSSKTATYGALKKLAVFLLVGLANVIDTELLGYGSAVRTATILFYISNEGISILENAANLGVAVPEKLRMALKQLREKESDK